jgi:hypothetical protein
MSFIIKTSVLRHTLVLALFLVSMLGPWMFELIPVPAQYACATPSVRLYDDFCGYPRSGFETIKWFGRGVSYILGELIKGNFAEPIHALIFLICALVVVLPFFSNFLLIGKRNSPRLQTMNVIVWGVACLPTLTMFILQTHRGQFVQLFYLLWGLGLFILLAMSTMLVEIVVVRLGNKASMTI